METLTIKANSLQAYTKLIQEHVGVDVDGRWGPRTAWAVLSALKTGWYPRPTGDLAEGPIIQPVKTQFDPATEAFLKTLELGAERAFRPFLAAAIALAAERHVELRAICGYRNQADQRAAVTAGRSKASYGLSWHNYGMAIDLGCFLGGKYLDETQPELVSTVYAAIGKIAPDHGIAWGGLWKNFQDEPHFQIDSVPVTPAKQHIAALMAGTWSFA